MELEFLYMMDNDQTSAISMSITSNIYHFFVFKKHLKIFPLIYFKIHNELLSTIVSLLCYGVLELNLFNH